jgi:hypothetical protein
MVSLIGPRTRLTPPPYKNELEYRSAGPPPVIPISNSRPARTAPLRELTQRGKDMGVTVEQAAAAPLATSENLHD